MIRYGSYSKALPGHVMNRNGMNMWAINAFTKIAYTTQHSIPSLQGATVATIVAITTWIALHMYITVITFCLVTKRLSRCIRCFILLP